MVDLKNFLTTKNLTLSDRLQEAQCNSEEGFKNVWVVFNAIGVPQREFWRWASAHDYNYGFTIDCALEEAT